MFSRNILAVGTLVLSGLLGACSDYSSPTTPTSTYSARTVAFSKSGGTDTSITSGGGTGGGGTGGGGSTSLSCGTLSSSVTTYNIVVYTTRIGIGFSGTATNCGTHNEALEVDVVDVNPDPVCAVDVPHYIAPKNTAPGETIYWSANSTLVNCMNTTHTFTLTLTDTKTGQVLATTTASAFL